MTTLISNKCAKVHEFKHDKRPLHIYDTISADLFVFLNVQVIVLVVINWHVNDFLH